MVGVIRWIDSVLFAASSAWLGSSSILGSLRCRSGSRLIADPELRADVKVLSCALLIVLQGCRPTLGDGNVLRNFGLFTEDKAAGMEGANLCEHRWRSVPEVINLDSRFTSRGEIEDVFRCFLSQLYPVARAVCQRCKLPAPETDVVFGQAVRTPLEGTLLQAEVPFLDRS